MTDTVTSDFDALLGEITDMAKAVPAEVDKKADAKVAAAAEDGVAESEVDDEDGEAAPVAKSFKLKLEDGSEVDALDGTALFKSLTERVEGNETKTLSAVRGLVDLVKSLTDEVKTLSAKGVGRKTVVAITEKPAGKVEDIAKAEADGVTSDDFFAKALAMQAEGKITGFEIQRAETHLNRGKPIPADIVRKVLGCSK